MKNSTRWILISSFILSLIIFSSVLSYGITQFDEVRNLSRDIVTNNNTKSEIINDMYSSARERVLDLYAMVNSDDPFLRDEIFLDFNKQGAKFATARAQLLKLDLSNEEKAILDKQGELTKISVPIQIELIDMIQEDRIDEAKELLSETGVEAQNVVLDELDKLLDHQKVDTRNIMDTIDEQYIKSKNLILTWSVIAFIFGAIIAILVIAKSSRIERQLFDEIENARAILTSISDAILKIDKDNRILFANDKAIEMFGVEICGHNIYKYLPDNILNKTDIYDKDISHDLTELKIGSKNIWLEVMSEDIHDESGLTTGKLIVLHDQTSIVNAQNRLKAANDTLESRVEERTNNLQISNQQLKESLESLDKANEQLIQSEKMAALGGLVAGISHEINTPVGIGVTAATNLEENIHSLETTFLSGKLTKSEFESFINQSQKGLDILIKNLVRASDLIKSFKLVAVDQSSDELRDIDLRSYCDEIILSLLPTLKTTSIKLSNEIPEDIHIHTNPGAIYQIISNLITNSITHAFDSTTEDEEINLRANINEDSLVLEYHDNGKGADKETITRIFDPFFTTKRGQGGSGLGMNVVYNLVTTSLKGKIDIDSTPEKGMTISMQVPLMQAS